MDQALVLQRMDNPIHWINHYPVDSVVCFVNTYRLDNNLSDGWCCPCFEQNNGPRRKGEEECAFLHQAEEKG